ncbi:substrate-binding domain-containing protein [Paenibacillus illinoisensis]|uniref:Substrate-binding domain-containing protein n=1 Tax=Paenibacillus illinoisensis TaxID=59845 RepID=A0ABW8HPG6_9BACL
MIPFWSFHKPYYVQYDYAAIGILFEARKQNIQVPEQLAIVGFDDIEWSRVLTEGMV